MKRPKYNRNPIQNHHTAKHRHQRPQPTKLHL